VGTEERHELAVPVGMKERPTDQELAVLRRQYWTPLDGDMRKAHGCQRVLLPTTLVVTSADEIPASYSAEVRRLAAEHLEHPKINAVTLVSTTCDGRRHEPSAAALPV
jgi:hypothetical protein